MCYSEKLATTTSTILRVIINLKDKLQTAPCILPILHCVYALKTLNLAFFTLHRIRLITFLSFNV